MRRIARDALVVLAALACRSTEPAPRAVEPTPEAQARALVDQARREVESAPSATAVADSARLHLPDNADSKLPLLVFLHGLGGSGGELVSNLRLDEMASALGFAFIAPDGVIDHSGRRFWNATDSCCNFDGLSVDHVRLLRQWITTAAANPHVDPERVYIVGFSNGGFMAYRAACEIGSLLRGVVSIAGAGLPASAPCRPERKLDVVEIHGDKDPIVKFDGGHLFADSRRPKHPSAEASVAYWAKTDGCTGDPVLTRDLDLDPRIVGAETAVSSYAGCGERRVELWRIQGGDHSAGLSRLSVKAIADFISASPAAPAGG
jgi:polyhydroxybutyrate depolymerase